MRLRYKRYELNYPKQEAFINDFAQYCYVEAGTKSGKTVGMIIWVHEEMVASKATDNFVWLAPNASTAKMAFLRLWETHIPNAHKRFYKINYSERFIQYPKGGRLWFVGADRPDMLYGRDYNGVIIDEASRIKETAYIAMLSTLATTNGPLRAIGNTKGKNNWFYRECQKAKAKRAAESREGVFHYHSLTSFDNPANDHEHMLDQKSRMPEAAFNELYLGIAADDGSNPFGLDNIAACVDKNAPQAKGTIYPNAEYFGVDLGSLVDNTSIIGLDAMGRVAYYETFRAPWNEVKERVMQAVGEKAALIDNTGIGKTVFEDIKQTMRCPLMRGFAYNAKGRYTKQDLMQNLAMGLCDKKLSFPDNLIREQLDNFEYKHTTFGIQYSAPAGQHDDEVNALALAFKCYRDYNRYVD